MRVDSCMQVIVRTTAPGGVSHRSSRSKKPITRRSYSAGSVVIPAMCWPFGTSQSCFGSPAAA